MHIVVRKEVDVIRKFIGILIADDHAAIRAGVRSNLEAREDWLVVGEAAVDHELLRLVRETQPDVVILDDSLPQMNWLELTRDIKHELPCTEVLIYATHNKDSVVGQALQSGARGFVLKSDSAEQLIAAVEALAKHKPYCSPSVCESVQDNFIQGNDGGEPHNVLTPREREVVQLVAEGKINKQVAHTLDISAKTVECHRAAVKQKLQINTTADLVRYALRNNMVRA
jgi:DNA-binding NarL/FixJ family response regulator